MKTYFQKMMEFKSYLEDFGKSLILDILKKRRPEIAEAYRSMVRIDLLNSRGYRGMQDFEKGKQ